MKWTERASELSRRLENMFAFALELRSLPILMATQRDAMRKMKIGSNISFWTRERRRLSKVVGIIEGLPYGRHV